MMETAVLDTTRACPACRGMLENLGCSDCDRSYPTVAGLPDLRLHSDRYLDLDAERAKAERLSRISESTDLEGVARAYYAMTEDVDPPRCQKYLAHILCAEARGSAFLSRWNEEGPTLEVGCGTGGMLVAAARRGWQIDGVDIAARWLVVARRRLADHGLMVPLTAASAECLPWPDATFGTVIADSLIEHCDDPVSALREWFRVLRPGGRLLLWSPNRFTITTDPHVRLWGLGYMPRRWAQAYSQLRRGGAWIPKTLSASGVERLARDVGFREISVDSPSISEEWSTGHTASRRWFIAVYQALQRFRPTRAMLRMIGPIWTLEARR